MEQRWIRPNSARSSIGSGHAHAGFVRDLLHLYDPERSSVIREGVLACAAAWREDRCRSDANGPANACDLQPLADRCQLTQLFAGELDMGADCNMHLAGPDRDIQCATGTRCMAIDGTDPDDPHSYRCTAAQQLDEFCTIMSSGDSQCDWHLRCDANTGKCVPAADLGEACEYLSANHPRTDQWRVPCRPGLYCDPNTFRWRQRVRRRWSLWSASGGCEIPLGGAAISRRSDPAVLARAPRRGRPLWRRIVLCPITA